jgi:hypothetical protein
VCLISYKINFLLQLCVPILIIADSRKVDRISQEYDHLGTNVEIIGIKIRLYRLETSAWSSIPICGRFRDVLIATDSDHNWDLVKRMLSGYWSV